MEFKERLKYALNVRNMKQSVLCYKTNLDKGTISNYLSGRYKPKSKNLTVIANALGVSEAWLQGYDVPMEDEINSLTSGASHETQKNSPTEPMLNEGEKTMLDLFKEVPEDKKQLVLDMIRVAISKKE